MTKRVLDTYEADRNYYVLECAIPPTTPLPFPAPCPPWFNCVGFCSWPTHLSLFRARALTVVNTHSEKLCPPPLSAERAAAHRPRGVRRRSTSNIDNPDQRMAEDLRAFTSTSLDFTISLITSVWLHTSLRMPCGAASCGAHKSGCMRARPRDNAAAVRYHAGRSLISSPFRRFSGAST